jgi:hypothetical protein
MMPIRTGQVEAERAHLLDMRLRWQADEHDQAGQKCLALSLRDRADAAWGRYLKIGRYPA